MPHQLNPAQGNALHYLALALRPEWQPNRPGATWQRAIDNNTLPHATSYQHAVLALMHYCQQTDPNGQPTKRTPNIYPHDGEHWTLTYAKTNPGVAQPPQPCEDHPEDGGGNTNCTSCWGDIKTGHRPLEYLGRHYEPNQQPLSPDVTETPSGRDKTGDETDSMGWGA